MDDEVKNMYAFVRLLASLPDFIGGEVECVELSEGVFRGPVKAIAIDAHTLTVDTEWVVYVKLDSNNQPVGEWQTMTQEDENHHVYDLGSFKLPGLSVPQGIDRPEVVFTYPSRMIRFFPKNRA